VEQARIRVKLATKLRAKSKKERDEREFLEVKRNEPFF